MAMNRYWHIPAIVLHVVLIAAVGCTQESADTKKTRHRERAVAYFDKGEYSKALIEFKNVVQIAPNDPDGHYRMALTYLKLGTLADLQQAFKELSTTVELNAENQDAQLKLGQLYLLSKDPGKARKHADIVLTTTPDNKEGVILRGASLLNEEKFQEGIAELKKAIVLDPQNIKIYIDLARAYVHIKDYGSAESVLQQALQTTPLSLEARFALGDLHVIKGKAYLAEAEYQRALSDAPDRPEPRLKLGSFYIAANRVTDAETTYSAWANAKPQDDTPLVMLGNLYRFTGRPDKALASYQQALAANPKSTTARNQLISLFIDTRQLDEAEKQTKAILEANSKDPDGRLFDGRLKLGRGQLEAAIAVLKPLSQEEARSPAVHHFLGRAYAAKNDLQQAVQELTEAVKLAPDSPESRTSLAAVYFTQGSDDLAIEQAQAALRLNPQSVQAAMLLGESYFHKGDVVKGKQVFDAVVKAEPGHAIAHYRLGLIARSKKNDADALVHFEQALTANPEFIGPLAEIATIKVSQGKQAEVRDRLMRHRDLAPKNALVYNLLGQFFTSAKQYDEAESAFKQAIELDGAALESYTGLAALYLRTKKVDLAVSEYETALSKNPKLISAMMVLGMIHEARGEYDKAQTRYQEALQVNPRFAPAANNLAWIMTERGGNHDVALGYASTAREVAPNDPSIADTLGWIYYKKNVDIKALSLLKEAAEKLPENPMVLYHLGMTLHRTGDTAGANKALKQALHLNNNFPGAEEAKRTIAASSQ